MSVYINGYKHNTRNKQYQIYDTFENLFKSRNILQLHTARMREMESST
jgi:hypothetical protein